MVSEFISWLGDGMVHVSTVHNLFTWYLCVWVVGR